MVYVMRGGESFSRVPVRLGVRDGDRYEVLEGLKAGDRVVSRGAVQVRLAAATPEAMAALTALPPERTAEAIGEIAVVAQHGIGSHPDLAQWRGSRPMPRQTARRTPRARQARAPSAVRMATPVLDALAALNIHEARLSLLTSGEALAWLAWAGASGGAHGRRRGNALGRDAAWWTIAALTGQTSHWPLTNDAFETATDSLQWFWWDANDPTSGWNVRLCVHHAERNRSWAFALTDMA